MRSISFAIFGAAAIVLAGSAAFAGSEAYVDGPAQAVYASPPSTQIQAEAYQDIGRLSAPLSAATALNGSGAQAIPKFVSTLAMSDQANLEVARRNLRGIMKE